MISTLESQVVWKVRQNLSSHSTKGFEAIDRVSRLNISFFQKTSIFGDFFISIVLPHIDFFANPARCSRG